MLAAQTISGTDGGWAWAVCATSCVINLIVNGQGRMSGILYRAFVVSFGVDRRSASTPFAVRTATRNLLGPLAGILGQKFGTQRTILFGGVTSAIGTALCFLASDIACITLLWGTIGSIGAALCMVQMQVVVGQYFKKYKTTAQGIAFSGACAGSFLFPVAVQCMLDNYGISGAFLVIAGLVLHTLPAAIVCKRPPWLASQQLDVQFLRDNEQVVVKLLKRVHDEPSNTEYEESRILEELKSMYASMSYGDVTSKMNNRYGMFDENTTKTSYTYKTCTFCLEKSPQSYCGSSFHHERFVKRDSDFYLYNVSSDALRSHVLSSIKRLLDIKPDPMAPDENTERIKRELQKLYNKNVAEENGSLAEQNGTRMVAKEKAVNSFWHHIQTTRRLMRNPFFLLICLCRIAHFVTFMPMMTAIVDFTVDRGFREDEGSAVIAALSAGDLVGRLFFGWVTDKGVLRVQRYMLVTMITQGANIAAFPLMPNKVTIYVFLCIFGILQGTIFVHHPTMVQRYVQTDAHSIAMGCMDFFPGLIGLAMPLYIGFFRDRMGSYDCMFHASGAFTAMVGAFWALEPHLQRRFAARPFAC